MANPIVEQIALSLEAAINAVTTGNGYNQTLHCVRRRKIDFQQTGWADGTALLRQAAADPVALPDSAIGTKSWEQVWNVEIIIDKTDDDQSPLETYCNLAAADLTNKLRETPSRGVASCWDTEIIHTEILEDANGVVEGIRVDVTCKFRTDENDWYS